MTPYQLVYGKTCNLPVELEFKSHWAIKRWNMDLHPAGVKRQIQLAELDEWREKAHHSLKLYKEWVKRWHDKRIKIKHFKAGTHRRAATGNTRSREAPGTAGGPWSLGQRPKIRHTTWSLGC
jgi:hypothetical protein